MNTKVNLTACPFCGSEELKIRAHDCMSWEVACMCGCHMIQRMPCEYSRPEKRKIKEIREELNITDMEAIAVFHMLNVAEKWNKRI
ncbi:hypothetical protein SBF1_7470001 [Candidatus Desulfosporosinus infrequens]|uniref:Uncharacterized protein n=1 Tax=Candidatus Desulfosporosinus infrequens TaxID=2043169 RepID=A0A2U3LR91_9FIRM|nr:hypothetical protein SBF1_7470001 [Candidatus Desulfosporosinus infrequens]